MFHKNKILVYVKREQDNCPLDNCPPKIASPEIVPQIICPWTTGAQNIAPQNNIDYRYVPPNNCHQENYTRIMDPTRKMFIAT